MGMKTIILHMINWKYQKTFANSRNDDIIDI